MRNISATCYQYKVVVVSFIYLLTLGYAPVKNETVTMPAVNDARPLRLFIIGNSFSQNAATYLPQMAKEKGKELVIGRAELGGCSLERHWKLAEAAEANPNDSVGKAYKGKSLRMLLSEGEWDVVTLQQYSLLSGDVDTYRPFAKRLYDLIRSIQPKAKIVLHQTWAYRADGKLFGKIKGERRAKDEAEMYASSRQAYHTIGDELNIPVIPVGDAFWKVNTHPKWSFKKDADFSKEKDIYPALPNEKNSLHRGYSWNKDKVLAFDAHHASAAGCYLGSLVWFSFLFGENTRTMKFKPVEVSDDFAAALKEAATSVTRPSSVKQAAAL